MMLNQSRLDHVYEISGFIYIYIYKFQIMNQVYVGIHDPPLTFQRAPGVIYHFSV